MKTLRGVAGLAVLAVVTVVTVPLGCMPELGDDPLPAVMDFDPTAEPALSPEPTSLLVHPDTGRIDFALAGIDVPEDCAATTEMPRAQCEFLTYLESLDGYPTLTPGRTPTSAPLDLATIAAPGNVVVVEQGRGEVVSEARVTFDEASGFLVVDPPGGWDVGGRFVIAVRGYEQGVRGGDGGEVVASVLYALLRGGESLTCDAPAPDALPADCGFALLFEGQVPPAEIGPTLFQLEGMRVQLETLGAWASAETPGGVPRDEVAIVWAFPTHTASVAELDPTRGLVPQLEGGRTLRVAVKGSVDPASLSPFTLEAPGSVFLLDLTLLEAEDFVGGLPAFTTHLTGGAIVLEAAQPLVDGHFYGVLLSSGITNDAGAPLVPSPVSVLLRSGGPLVDADGRSQVEGVADADAQELEAGRGELAELLDSPLFSLLTGLERGDLVYVYAFDYPPPAPGGGGQ